MINKKILLIGGSGNLGSCIKKSKIFKKLISPKKKSLNLLNKKKNWTNFIKKQIRFNNKLRFNGKNENV